MSKELHHLFKAIKEHRQDQVHQILVNDQSIVNTKDDHGATALTVAAQYGTDGIVHTLVKYGAHLEYQYPGGLKGTDFSGCCPLTALIIAVESQNYDAAHALLEAGANPNAFNDCLAESALAIAAQVGNLDLVKLLLKYNADINGKSPTQELYTPLMTGARAGNLEIIAYLLEHNADATLADFSDRTAVDHAHEGKSKNMLAIIDLLKRYMVKKA